VAGYLYLGRAARQPCGGPAGGPGPAGPDEGDSKFRGGEGYGKRRGEIKPAEAETHLFQMRDGDIRMVELASGVHVIKLVKREYAGLMPFDEKTQKFILNKLKNEAAEREWKKILKDLKSKVVIERDMSP
jgi:peptidyl-prolyl cis-trans isomerase SurA